MEITTESLSEQLKSKGIRASFQRIKVLEYLQRSEGHPAVEEIFCALLPDVPSLSKVTIYNTLHTFVEAGLIRVVEIDGAQMRYDIVLDDHGHFLCEACGAIYNFPVNIRRISMEGLNQFKITQKNVYFKGLCPKCVNRSINPQKE